MQKLLYGVAGFIAVLVAIGLAMPRTHRVEVATRIDAYPATVFALLNDFRRHALWTPLANSDKSIQIRYSGSATGVGATMSWNGVSAGSGTETIIESIPHQRITIAINPGEPGEAVSVFTLSPGPGTTTVSRIFETDYGMNLVGRYFAPVFGGIVARDYEAGLAGLRELAQSMPKADFSELEIERVVTEASEIAYLSTSSRPGSVAISAAMDDAYFQVLRFVTAANLAINGAPMAIIQTFSGAEVLFDAAIPVTRIGDSRPAVGNPVRLELTYAGPAVRVRHVGPYRTLPETHRKIDAYLAAAGLERNGAYWESYLSDAGNVPEADLVTEIYYPVRPFL